MADPTLDPVTGGVEKEEDGENDDDGGGEEESNAEFTQEKQREEPRSRIHLRDEDRSEKVVEGRVVGEECDEGKDRPRNDVNWGKDDVDFHFGQLLKVPEEIRRHGLNLIQVVLNEDLELVLVLILVISMTLTVIFILTAVGIGFGFGLRLLFRTTFVGVGLGVVIGNGAIV
jgi:hypothetical protein